MSRDIFHQPRFILEQTSGGAAGAGYAEDRRFEDWSGLNRAHLAQFRCVETNCGFKQLSQVT